MKNLIAENNIRCIMASAKVCVREKNCMLIRKNLCTYKNQEKLFKLFFHLSNYLKHNED